MAGTYTFALSVTDNNGAVATASVTVIVLPATNKAPVANAGKDVQIKLPVNTTVLDGSASADQDGTIVSWSWKKTGGPAAGGDITSAGAATTAVTGLIAGTYTYTLTVTDNDGAAATANVNVVVLPADIANLPPLASAGNNQGVQLPTNTALLDGSGSSDQDGSIVTWLWKKTAGPAGGNITSPGSATTSITGLIAGTYTYSLTVTDNDGATATASVKIVVVSPDVTNTPPVAVTQGDKTIRLPTDFVLADGTPSYDTDGKIVTYLWKQLSGPVTAGIQAADKSQSLITGLKEGSYTFQLTVTDDQQATASATFKITVQKDPVEQHHSDSIALFPNPVTTIAKLKIIHEGTNTAHVKIYTMSGREYMHLIYTFSDVLQADIDMSRLPNGYYLMQVKMDDVIWNRRFIKINR